MSDALAYMLRKEGFEVAVCLPDWPGARRRSTATRVTWCCSASCSRGQLAPKYAGSCPSGRMCR
jgi:hypothetical protein